MLWQMLSVCLVGLQLGVLETAVQRWGDFSLTAGEVGQLIVAHLLASLLVAPPFLVAGWMLARAAARGRDGSRWRRAAARFAPTAPAVATALALGAVIINLRVFRGLIADGVDAASLLSLLGANAAFACAIAGAGLAWAYRPWTRTGDWIALALLIAVDAGVAWAAVAPGPSAEEVARTQRAGRPGPDIVLILIDTLRADHLGVYGYERDTSPNLDRFAEQALVFERAFSSTNWTRPAVASLFTSTMPSRHGVTSPTRAVSPSLPLLAEVLSERGYRTGFFTAGANVLPEDGYARGVDRFYHRGERPATERAVLAHQLLIRFPRAGRLFRGPPKPRGEGSPEEITRHALEWVEELGSEGSMFMYVHYMGPHHPYKPPPPYDRAYSESGIVPRLATPPQKGSLFDRAWAGREALSASDRKQMISQYDGEITWHDHQLQRLFEALRAAGRLDDAVVVITADHGEGFGEHGVWAHTAGMFNEVVRIPLIIWRSAPEARRGHTRVPVSLLDIAPTLAELAGAPTPASFDGGSLVPWLEGSADSGRVLFIENPDRAEIGVRNDEWAYFEGRSPDGFRQWLYRADDLEHETDLSAEHPEVVRQLSALANRRREMDRARGSEGVELELSADRIEQLRELGYVAE